jgi:hypothetical protein
LWWGKVMQAARFASRSRRRYNGAPAGVREEDTRQLRKATPVAVSGKSKPTVTIIA